MVVRPRPVYVRCALACSLVSARAPELLSHEAWRADLWGDAKRVFNDPGLREVARPCHRPLLLLLLLLLLPLLLVLLVPLVLIVLPVLLILLVLPTVESSGNHWPDLLDYKCAEYEEKRSRVVV